ncbi:MAG: hypothetical protein IT557_18510 [Alphaproteobacteria bacterium]|nr:hypothetical protein [Alphaproteobacteria bacterium]
MAAREARTRLAAAPAAGASTHPTTTLPATHLLLLHLAQTLALAYLGTGAVARSRRLVFAPANAPLLPLLLLRLCHYGRRHDNADHCEGS